MFFWLSKVLDTAVEPLTWWLVLLLVGGLAWRRGQVKWAARAVSLSVVAVLVPSLPLVSRGLEASLEHGVVSAAREGTYDAVILLGGVVDYAGTSPDQLALNDNVERLLAVFELLRAGRAEVAIVSGGTASQGKPEAELLTAQLQAWGIAPTRLLAETTSLNTRQNAQQVGRVVRAHGFKRLLLVTSAYHGPRAVGCFQAEGMAVDVYPVDFRALNGEGGVWPSAAALNRSARVMREYLGRGVYAALGYTSSTVRAPL